jgi:hypothetical protein
MLENLSPAASVVTPPSEASAAGLPPMQSYVGARTG